VPTRSRTHPKSARSTGACSSTPNRITASCRLRGGSSVCRLRVMEAVIPARQRKTPGRTPPCPHRCSANGQMASDGVIPGRAHGQSGNEPRCDGGPRVHAFIRDGPPREPRSARRRRRGDLPRTTRPLAPGGEALAVEPPSSARRFRFRSPTSPPMRPRTMNPENSNSFLQLDTLRIRTTLLACRKIGTGTMTDGTCIIPRSLSLPALICPPPGRQHDPEFLECSGSPSASPADHTRGGNHQELPAAAPRCHNCCTP